MSAKALLGGEFDIAPHAIVREEVATPWDLPPLLASTGRCALQLAASTLKASGCRSILLPAFACQSVVDPFLAARFEVRFFPIDRQLQIEPSTLDALLREHPTAALLFINYFGFPPGATALKLLRAAARSRYVLEDCSHGSWIEGARPCVGNVGHFVFSSLRKYLPLPDGCLVANSLAGRATEPKNGDLTYASQRFVAAQLKHEYLRQEAEDEATENVYLKLFLNAERSIEALREGQACSSLSQRLFRKVDLPIVRRRRRTNFQLLHRGLSSDRRLSKHIEPVIPSLPAAVSPMVLPVKIRSREKRNAWRSALARQRLYCAVHWPLPEQVEAENFPETHALANEILSLPVDQRYGPAEIEEILRRLRRAASEV